MTSRYDIYVSEIAASMSFGTSELRLATHSKIRQDRRSGAVSKRVGCWGVFCGNEFSDIRQRPCALRINTVVNSPQR